MKSQSLPKELCLPPLEWSCSSSDHDTKTTTKTITTCYSSDLAMQGADQLNVISSPLSSFYIENITWLYGHAIFFLLYKNQWNIKPFYFCFKRDNMLLLHVKMTHFRANWPFHCCLYTELLLEPRCQSVSQSINLVRDNRLVMELITECMLFVQKMPGVSLRLDCETATNNHDITVSKINIHKFFLLLHNYLPGELIGTSCLWDWQCHRQCPSWVFGLEHSQQDPPATLAMS